MSFSWHGLILILNGFPRELKTRFALSSKVWHEIKILKTPSVIFIFLTYEFKAIKRVNQSERKFSVVGKEEQVIFFCNVFHNVFYFPVSHQLIQEIQLIQQRLEVGALWCLTQWNGQLRKSW